MSTRDFLYHGKNIRRLHLIDTSSQALEASVLRDALRWTEGAGDAVLAVNAGSDAPGMGI
jgi:hypothetical protein